MIVGRLERKTSDKAYLSGRLSQDVAKGTLVILKRDDQDPDKYVLWELGPRNINTKTAGFLF